jgi:hypothetical protein
VQVSRHHALALRGFHVATHTALRELRGGTAAPTVFDQNWWNRCFNSCGSLKGRRNTCTKDASIQSSIQELFGTSPPIDSSYVWPFINELSKGAVTMTQNMMGANFHAELGKAVRREVVIYEWESGTPIEKETRWKLVQHFVKLAGSHQTLPSLPVGVPAVLVSQLHALMTSWKNKFSSQVPHCPVESYIYSKNPLSPSKTLRETSKNYLEGIFLWMHAMQVHRLACLQHLQQMLPPEQVKTARSIFGKCAKPLAPLPMSSFNVPHMAISRDNGLHSLCSGANLPVEKDFYKIFPNLRKFDRGCKCHFIRTDGVTVCLVMKREAPKPTRKRKREQSKEDSKNGGPNRGPEPRLPQEGQRLVGIDPGRRDMIGLVSNEGDSFTVSTKSFRHISGSARYARQTVSLLSRKEVGEETLYDLLQKLPCRRDIDEWTNYLRCVLPILDTIIATYEVKRLRRLRFQSFMKRDRALDAICKRITASKENVLVAFGDASACHTGFGYAPAPQGRLRKRLGVIHAAQVTLIDEYNTSRYCCRCHHVLLEPRATHSLAKIMDSQILTNKLERKSFRKLSDTIFEEKLHGVRQCSFCRNESGCPKFHHRDLNSAQNMMDVYLSLASNRTRPDVFLRS